MMLSNEWIRTGQKRQRIMIITDDENILDKIEKNTNISLMKQSVDSSTNNMREMMNKKKNIDSSNKNNKIKDDSLTCVVCESSANGYHFGAITCESCKAFFRRHARKASLTFHCNNNCKITFETRRDCSSCRLTKCFNSGMQCDRFLTIEQKAKKRRQIEDNRNLSLKLNSNKLNEQYQLSIIDKNIVRINFTDILSSQSQQTLLSLEDIQHIETISYLYHNRIEFAYRHGLPWDPLMHTNTFLDVLNSHSISIIRLLSFFKQIPEFNKLNVDDKVILIKYNIITVLGINCTLIYNSETDQIIEVDCELPWNNQYFQVLHGYNTCMKSKKIFNSFLSIAKYDRKIIELILIIIILTKNFFLLNNESILNDNISVYRLQNFYIELLWKYMETMYGYEKSVDLFSQFILHLISWQIIQEQMRYNILQTLSPDDLNQLLPIMKSILHLS